jgi:uncharacterized protein YbcV (DUF1398 family)
MTEEAQPLDTLMTRLGLSNAALVNASTEQLSFKNVQKGRAGKRLTPNIQDKILTALLVVKPDLKLKRRDLFRYDANPDLIEAVQNALNDVRDAKINYPQFVDRLIAGGVIAYVAEVGPNKITFLGYGGETHVEQGPMIDSAAPGLFNEAAIKSAIAAAQKRTIDHPTFLARIHDAGVSVYEVDTRKRRIDYKGEGRSYREFIPEYVPESGVPAPPALEPAADTKPKLSNKKKKAATKLKKNKKPGIVRTTRKKRLTINKLYRAKKRAARRPKGKPTNPKTKRGPRK